MLQVNFSDTYKNGNIFMSNTFYKRPIQRNITDIFEVKDLEYLKKRFCSPFCVMCFSFRIILIKILYIYIALKKITVRIKIHSFSLYLRGEVFGTLFLGDFGIYRLGTFYFFLSNSVFIIHKPKVCIPTNLQILSGHNKKG